MNTIKRTIEITDEMIEDLLCSAFEGGSTYWAGNVSCHNREDMKKVGGHKSNYLTRTNLKDAKLIIHALDGGEVAITKQSIIDALQKMDDPEYKYTKSLQRILNETWDACDSDNVLQTACFGEVIYG